MAKPTFDGLYGRFMWNLSGNVGRNSPNLLADVELVRYGYFCYSLNPKMSNPQLLPIIANMSTYGGYDSDLQDVIDFHEQARGGTQDGHVSAMPPGGIPGLGAGNYDANHIFLLVTLNNNMNMRDMKQWPRIDLAAESGPEITRYAQTVFWGV